MASLPDYRFDTGRHPFTGAITGALEYSGVVAPHTGRPFSEALLAGVAGGIMVGYFFFDYAGNDPQINIVTRNSFNDYGFEHVVTRLGIPRELYQTTSAEKARDNLLRVIETGEVPIVTADVYTLGYETSDFDTEMWSMQPVVVPRYEFDGDATIADRSRVPLSVASARFDAARGRVKKDRHRIVTLDVAPIAAETLAAAVETGIRDCLALYADNPPAGSPNNFGIRALERWAKALRSPAGKTSWHKLFAGGRRLFAALSSAYRFSALFWKDESECADRGLYADFLDEAAEILSRPTLRNVAETYRDAADAWRDLSHALLPDDDPLLGEERRLRYEDHTLFLNDGTDAASRRDDIARRRAELRASADHFATDERARTALLNRVADAVDEVLARESAAQLDLRATMDG